MCLSFKYLYNNLDGEEEDLHGADEREAREEPHCSSYSGELVHQLSCAVLRYFYEVNTI